MRWKTGPVLALCLLLAWPSHPKAAEPVAEATAAGHSDHVPENTGTAGDSSGQDSIRKALEALSVRSMGEEIPPEPPREKTGSTRTPWYRSRTAIILMVVVGAVVLGTTALNTLREDT